MIVGKAPARPTHTQRGAATRRLALISYVAPPAPKAAAARAGASMTLLPHFGWEVAVYAAQLGTSTPPPEVTTLRDPFVAYSHAADSLTARAAAANLKALRAKAKRLLAIPDPHILWSIGVASRVAREGRRRPFDVVMSTSPPESSHLAGYLASRLLGVPWVMEFRDGWLFDSLKGDEMRGWRRRTEAFIERYLCARASARIGLTRPIADDLAARFTSARFIPNGYDAEPIPSAATLAARRLLPERGFNFLYTGGFSTSRATRSPENLARAMEAAALSGAPPFNLVVMGDLTPSETSRLRQLPNAVLTGPQPRTVVLAAQSLADALVLVTMPDEATVATGKLFEYLGTRRPILALAQGNEAARIVDETGAGFCVAPDDVSRAAALICDLASGRLLAAPQTSDIERYSRITSIASLSSLLADVANQSPRASSNA